MHNHQPADGDRWPESTPDTATAGARLRLELADLKNDLDALMSHQTTLSDDELSEAYARIMARLGSSSTTAKDVELAVGQRPYPGTDQIYAYVRRRPIQSIVLASIVGMLAARLGRHASK